MVKRQTDRRAGRAGALEAAGWNCGPPARGIGWVLRREGVCISEGKVGGICSKKCVTKLPERRGFNHRLEFWAVVLCTVDRPGWQL